MNTLYCEQCGEAEQEVRSTHAGLCGDCYGQTVSDTLREATGDHLCCQPLFAGGRLVAICAQPHGIEHAHADVFANKQESTTPAPTTTTTTKMFFVLAESRDDGENYDLFVEAASLPEAAKLWAEYYGVDGADEELSSIHIKRIYEAPGLTGVVRSVSWGAMPLFHEGWQESTP